MSQAIKFNASMNASNQTVGGVTGIFLPGRALNATEYTIEDCRVHQSTAGDYYDFEPYTNSDVYVFATELVASVVTVSGTSGVLLSAVAGQGGTPSVNANGTAANLYQCSLAGGDGVRGRSGVS